MEEHQVEESIYTYNQVQRAHYDSPIKIYIFLFLFYDLSNDDKSSDARNHTPHTENYRYSDICCQLPGQNNDT